MIIYQVLDIGYKKNYLNIDQIEEQYITYHYTMDAKYELKIKVMGRIIKARVYQNDKLSKIINMLRQKQIIKNFTIDSQIKIINRQNYRQLNFQTYIRQFSVCELSGVREIQVRVSECSRQRFDDVLYQDNAEQIRLKCINYLLQNKQDNAKDLLKNKNFSFKYLELLQQLKRVQNNQQSNEKMKRELQKLQQQEQQIRNQLAIKQSIHRDQLQSYEKIKKRLKNQINDIFNYLIQMVESDNCAQIKNKDEFSSETQSILDYIYHNINKLKTESKIKQIKLPQPQIQVKQELSIQNSESKISELEQSLQSSEKKSEKAQLSLPPPLNTSENINNNIIRSIQEYFENKRKIINIKSQFIINATNNDLIKKISDKHNFILKFFVNQKLFGFFSPQPIQPMSKIMKSQKGFLFTFIDSKIEVIKPKQNQILWKKSQIDIIIGQKVIQIQKNLKVNKRKEFTTAFDCRSLTNAQIFGTDAKQFMLTSIQLMTVQFNQFELLQSSEKRIKQEKGSNLKKEQ